MTTYILALQQDVEKRYSDFTYERQGFAGRSKASGMVEILGQDAFRIMPLTELFSELEVLVNKVIEKQAQKLGPEIAASFLSDLERQVDEAKPSG